MAHLVAIRGPSSGKQYPLENNEVILGRSFNSDIIIGDLNVSRRHARISVEGNDLFVIEDLGSGNGTFVNETQITRHELRPKDVIRIGSSSFRYEPTKKQQWAEDVLTVVAGAISQEALYHRTIPPISRTIPPGSTDTHTSQVELEQELDSLANLADGQAVEMLKSMYAVADAIATELDLEKLLAKILDHLLHVFPQAERGFVLLVNPATGQLVPEAIRQRRGSGDGLVFSRTMVNQVMEKGKGVIRDAPPGSPATGQEEEAVGSFITDELNRFKLDESDEEPTKRPDEEPTKHPPPQPLGGPKMGAPLVCRGEMLGTLHLEAGPGSQPFSKEGLTLLSAIARQAGVAIANAQAGQALLMQQRLEDDLRLARQIQQSFLPEQLTQLKGLEFDTHYVPAHKVGGDFYDIIPLSPSRIGVLVGDISGKGVSAALLMAKLTTDIRLLARMHQSPAEVMTRANKALAESEREGMFATVIYLMVDLDDRTFTVANAGHQPPMVVSSRYSGIAELDDATAVALGVIGDMEYPQKVYKLLPEDVVLLYTDGINEAMNRQSQEYGMDRLRAAVSRGSLSSKQLIERILADVRRFVGGAPQSDDQTLVTFELSTE